VQEQGCGHRQCFRISFPGMTNRVTAIDTGIGAPRRRTSLGTITGDRAPRTSITARIAITANDSLTPGTRLSHAAAFPEVTVKRSQPARTMT
jgi:hypothetical protein